MNNLLPTLFAPLLSLLVIRQTSATLWGTFVGVLITVQLGAHIVAWGNHEYLLRDFSRNPASIARLWQTNVQTRMMLFALVALVTALLYPEIAGWVILWGAALILHQSCAVLITYKKVFIFSAAVESIGLVAMIAAVFTWGPQITPNQLVTLFALVTLAKAAILLIRFRAYTWGEYSRFDLRYFMLAFPFFLLGFSGMLNSRIDLYVVHSYLPPADVGQYQVFTSYLLYIQSLSAFILLPFVKSIYRLQYAAIRKISFFLFGLGLLIVPPAMLVLFLLLTTLYRIHMPPAFFLLGGLTVLPIFYFLPTIYGLYKAERQTRVIWINLLGSLLTLLLNLAFLPRLGLLGAVLATVTVEWIILLIYVREAKVYFT